MPGMDLAGKRLGMIGKAGPARASGLRWGYDPGMPARRIARPMPLLAPSDLAVLALPAKAQIHHIIDAAALRAMRP